jgi:hypothetical protein
MLQPIKTRLENTPDNAPNSSEIIGDITVEDNRDFDYVIGKLPRKDKDGNDVTRDRMGKGGRHRENGTFSVMPYDLKVVENDPAKPFPRPQPQVIVRNQYVEVERPVTRYEDLSWYEQIFVDAVAVAVNRASGDGPV